MGSGGRRRRATAVPYGFMSLDEIAALPIADLAEDDAFLFLRTTRRLFREGEAATIVRAWGFEPKGEIIWGLRNPGMGGFLGSGHEPILVATRGAVAFPPNLLPGSVQFWRQTYQGGKVHSAKPEAFLDHVESLCPGPYVELFARRARFGWDYWGDQSLGTASMPERAA